MQAAGLIFGTIIVVLAIVGLRMTSVRRMRRTADSADVRQHWRDRVQASHRLPKKTSAWVGPRTFIVERKKREADGVMSVYLVPEDGRPLPPFRPGQFITLQLDLDGHPAPVRRCYSLSRAPREDHYRITVKHLANGLGSSFVHEELSVGDTVNVLAPSGRFFLNESAKPVVMVAGGIGVTPFLSMLEALADNVNRPATLLYSTRKGRDHACKDELRRLVAKVQNLRVVTFYTAAESTDVLGVDYDVSSRIDITAIRSVTPELDAEYYICGSAAMTAALTDELKTSGVEPSAIRSEGFGGAPVKRASTGDAAPAADATMPVVKITFKESGKTLDWDGTAESILDLAERNGVEIDSVCRAGDCGTCEVALLTGSVAYNDGSTADSSTGTCLACVSRPTSDIVLIA